MWKVALSFLILCQCFVPLDGHADTSATHLKKLNAKYPFGLLGDDFNLLTTTDLAANACGFDPVPFPSRLPGYSYWQCFHTKDVAFKCDPTGGIHELGQAQQVILVLEVHDSRGHQEYLSRRYIDLGTCIQYRREWQKLTHGEAHVCISGPYIHSELGSDEKYTAWIFEKYKTRFGCASYFDGACDVKNIVKTACESTK